MGILSSYPTWFLILCLLLGLTYSFTLYFRNKNKVFSKFYTSILFAVRFLSTSIIAFLLLEPIIKINTKIYDKAIVAIVHDNSTSMILGKDSSFLKNEFHPIISSWKQNHKNEVDFFDYTYGDKFTENSDLNYSEKSTNISQIFDEIKNRFLNRNLKGIVIVSDGIYNSGSNPLNAATKLNVPIYTVAIGDTTKKRDLSISALNGNRDVVFNNYFPIEISINAVSANNLNSTLTISLNDKTIFSQDINISSNQFSKLINIKALADKKGLNKIAVSFKPVLGEKNTINNYRTFYFNVIDDKKKIVLFANSPHPDINAISSALESNEGFELKTFTKSFSVNDLENANLLILHQLPSQQNKIHDIIDYSRKAGIPTIFIIGQQTLLSELNTLNIGTNVKIKLNQFTDAQCVINENFQQFTIPQEEKTMVQSMPPLSVPFGTYSLGSGVNVLAYQKIGNIATTQPAISFSEFQNTQQSIIYGEGLWRWRIYEYIRSKSHKNFDNFISRIAQYLSQNSNRSKFRVIYKTTHTENEKVQFFAELYNANFELTNEPEVVLNISNTEGKTFSHSFIANNAGYSLNCGQLKPGKYKFNAKVNNNKYPYSQSGEFTVDEYNSEYINLTADHNMLKLLAENNGGKMVYPNNLEKISTDLQEKGAFDKTYHRQTNFQNIIELKWLLLVIIGLLTIEWIIRKREGYY